MSTGRDEEQRLALGLVGLLVAVVVAGAVAFAAVGSLRTEGAPPAGVERVYFEGVDGADEALPAAAAEVLARVAAAARADGQVSVLIAGVRERNGDTTRAQRRALRVRHALEADGVPPAQLLLGQPLPAPRSRAAKDSARVDIRLQ